MRLSQPGPLETIFYSGLLAMAAFVVSVASGQEANPADAPRALPDAPRALDDRLQIELVVEQPDIVTPTGIAVDRQGRLYVAESHTHFRPDNYDGHEKDRILVFEDLDEDGQLDRRVLHEGLTHLMDLEFHPDGSLYAATRRDIHRIELDAAGNLAGMTRVVDLQTTGDYPHNGLSGLAFDFQGRLHFGLGENLGHPYKLIGSDGSTFSGGGEGGTTYVVAADGSNLQRVTTGWWNPFGMCVDGMDRVFGTDNDPGASPPCRLIQVVDQADYGYEYRYGRSGLHPLITWTGDLPGTLPMIAGTGEAPCAILSYESTGLPEEYYGQLFTAAWADHRIERYRLIQEPNGGLVQTSREILIEGGNEFRPVSLAVGPDGSLYVTDWVSASYSLHGLGRIWRIHTRPDAAGPDDANSTEGREVAATSRDAFRRAQAARELAQSNTGRTLLLKLAQSSDDRHVRATAVQALALRGSAEDPEWQVLYENEEDPEVRLLLVKLAVTCGVDPVVFYDAAGSTVAERAVAVAEADPAQHAKLIESAIQSSDPWLFHAGIQSLARAGLTGSELQTWFAKHPVATSLAVRRSDRRSDAAVPELLPKLFAHADPTVRLVAVKWVADEEIKSMRTHVASLLKDSATDYRLFLATAAALARLDGQPPLDRPSPELLTQLLTDDPPDRIRALALRMLPSDLGGLPDAAASLVRKLVDHENPTVQREAVRTLGAGGIAESRELLVSIATAPDRPELVRTAAIAGLASYAGELEETFMQLAFSNSQPIRDEALRSLIGVELPQESRRQLEQLAANHPQSAEAVNRLLEGRPGIRPDATDLDAWLQLLAGEGDPAVGEQIFFGTKVGTCSKCHSIDGRGTDVGPDLSQMARRLRSQGPQADRWLLETILQPSKDMAPQYTPWMILTTDGKTHVGLPRRKGGSAEAYLGIDGKEFTLKKSEIEMHKEQAKSIMPDDLLRPLTSSELRGLFAFLRQSAEHRQSVAETP